MFNNQIIAGAAGQGGSFYDYSIDQSLRFEEADTPSLSRTQTSGTTTTWTFSAWVKRSRLDSVSQTGGVGGQDPIFTVGDANTNDMLLYFTQHSTADRLDIIIRDSSTIRAQLTTTRQFRDVSAFYHIQVTCDFTNATQGDRLRLYVNGVRETIFDTETYPSDTSQITVVNNSSYTARIGRLRTEASYFAGYMSEVHLVDGSALEPTSFGEFSNGVWIPKEYSGSYGTNGFYLSFADSAAIGRDKAGSKTLVTSTSFSTIGGGTTNFTQSEADKGFDNDKSTNVDRTGTSGLIEITPTSSVTPVSHTMINANSTSYTAASRPNSVKLQGSNDGGSTWTDIDTLTNGSGANTATTSSFSNTTSYAKLRLNIASNHGGSNTRFAEYVVFASEDNGDGENIFFKYNLVASDVVPDSPTLNYPTFNPLVNTGQSGLTHKEGNLEVASTSTWSSSVWSRMTMAGHGGGTGKFYAEFVNYGSSGGGSTVVGVGNYESLATSTTKHSDAIIYYYDYIEANNTRINIGGNYASPPGISGNEVVRMAWDCSNGKVWIGASQEWFDVGSGVGDPANDSNPSGTISNFSGSPIGVLHNRSTNTGQCIMNFGQNGTFNNTLTAGGYSDENGYGNFFYEVPSGFVALNSASLLEPTIGPNSTTTSDEHFNTVLWSGDGASSRAITGVGFQPDFTWHKARNNGTQTHQLLDVVRGKIGAAASFARLRSDTTAIEATPGSDSGVLSFDSDGFTIGSDSAHNNSSYTYVGWNWKAGGTAVSNTDGSITSSVSANQDAGFSIATWTGNQTAGATVGHGLSETPEIIFVKNRDSAQNWVVWNKDLTSERVLYLHLTNAENNSPATFGTHTNQVFGVDNSVESNGSGNAMIAYCFHSSDVCKVGSYVGNGNADGPFIYTGFRPAWIMMKVAIGGTGNWFILDATRSAFNEADDRLNADVASAESTGNSDIDFLSNGIKIRTASTAGINQSGDTHIYLAFAEAPFKYANAR